jgi:transposase
MSKTLLKTKLRKQQNGLCSVSAAKLAKETRLFDTDRIEPKVNGGIYTDENTRVLDPVAHMKRHFIYRERTLELTQLKVLIDGREQIIKLMNSLNNRLLAAKRRTDEMDAITKEWIEEQVKETSSQLHKQNKRIDKFIKSLNLPIVSAMNSVKGLGTTTMAYLLIYIDIKKADHASSLWSYVGLDKPSHERYTKGESGGGNKTLRTVLWAWADSGIRTRSVYREVYDREKLKLENSMKFIKSRNTQGKLIECMWKDTKLCHRHGAGIRKMIKHFLADLWFVWREIEGLPTTPLYAEAVLGHTGIIRPEERGWEVKSKLTIHSDASI